MAMQRMLPTPALAGSESYSRYRTEPTVKCLLQGMLWEYSNGAYHANYHDVRIAEQGVTLFPVAGGW